MAFTYFCVLLINCHASVEPLLIRAIASGRPLYTYHAPHATAPYIATCLNQYRCQLTFKPLHHLSAPSYGNLSRCLAYLICFALTRHFTLGSNRFPQNTIIPFIANRMPPRRQVFRRSISKEGNLSAFCQSFCQNLPLQQKGTEQRFHHARCCFILVPLQINEYPLIIFSLYSFVDSYIFTSLDAASHA